MRSILEVIVFLGTLLPVSVVATPIPLSSPLMVPDFPLNINHSSLSHTPRNLTAAQYTSLQNLRSSVPSDSQEHARAVDTLAELYQYYNAARESATTINALAPQASSVNSDNLDYQQQLAAAVSEYNANVARFRSAFARAKTGRGLANYDRTNDLETLLKDFVNLTKNTMQAIYDAVLALPMLGPILGPLIYDLKCLIDEILDVLEEFTDALINAIQPLLAALLGQTVTAACASGVELAGLCI
ncbi:hypothetical protein BDN70DRAFT_876400 [Pholiota conissans]|uniref:Uncharacterized protein n=1 Tax=Pholiota conissans TaxID=109636 RepID=A0A9P6D2T8_9AGAR|nr:hypothetical protein BDN70DRAFT_876400 [Pholiota conissans]